MSFESLSISRQLPRVTAWPSLPGHGLACLLCQLSHCIDMKTQPWWARRIRLYSISPESSQYYKLLCWGFLSETIPSSSTFIWMSHFWSHHADCTCITFSCCCLTSMPCGGAVLHCTVFGSGPDVQPASGEASCPAPLAVPAVPWAWRDSGED